MLDDIAKEEPHEFLRDRQADFYSGRMQDLQVLNVAASQDDFKKVREIGHNWVGVCEPYGFQGLGEIGRRLVEAGRAEDSETVSDQVLLASSYLRLKKSYIDFSASSAEFAN
jgi:hypothetical protein